MKNSQKGFIAPLVLVIISMLVIGGGAYFYTKNKTQITTEPEVYKNNSVSGTPKKLVTSSPSKESSQKVTFSDFLNKGGSYICSVSRYIDRDFMGDTKISGTAYTNGKLIRVDYDPNMLSLIYKDNKTYWWWGIQNPNYKDHPNDGYIVEKLPPGAYGWKSEDIIDYDCKAWTPDNSKFVVPSNLVFPQMIKPLCQYRSDLKPPDCD